MFPESPNLESDQGDETNEPPCPECHGEGFTLERVDVDEERERSCTLCGPEEQERDYDAEHDARGDR